MLAELALIGDLSTLKENHAGWHQEMLLSQDKGREAKWSTSIAVGGERFVTKVKELLGVRAAGRRIANISNSAELRKPSLPFSYSFIQEKDRLRGENIHFLRVYPDNTDS